jgi:hypothetical protein
MTFLSFVLALAAIVTLLLAGYLVGARRGRSARASLSAQGELLGARVADLETQLAPLAAAAAANANAAAHAAAAANAANEANATALANAATASVRNNDSLREEIRGLISTAQKPTHSPEQMSRDIQKALAPLLDRERLGRELSSIRVGAGGLGELPKLLDEIAIKAGFASVVLSDDSGLPLAANSAASNVDVLAGMASFFLTLAERAERASLPPPLSCVVLDTANRLTLHRMFNVGASRFTLSAVSRGVNIAPGALDPALSPLERVLGRQELS